MQKCILKWLVSVSESVSASERIRTFQLPYVHLLNNLNRWYKYYNSYRIGRSVIISLNHIKIGPGLKCWISALLVNI